jgi:hypothetical protein
MLAAPLPLRQVNIGDQVSFQGRLYVLRGMDPMSVPDRVALIEDAWTGELVRAPFDEVRPAENGAGFEPEGLG